MHDIAFYLLPKPVDLTNQLLSRIDFTMITHHIIKKNSKQRPHDVTKDQLNSRAFPFSPTDDAKKWLITYHPNK